MYNWWGGFGFEPLHYYRRHKNVDLAFQVIKLDDQKLKAVELLIFILEYERVQIGLRKGKGILLGAIAEASLECKAGEFTLSFFSTVKRSLDLLNSYPRIVMT